MEGMSSLQAMGPGWPCPMLAFTSGSARECAFQELLHPALGVPAAGVAVGLPSSMADVGGGRGHFKIVDDFRIVDD